MRSTKQIGARVTAGERIEMKMRRVRSADVFVRRDVDRAVDVDPRSERRRAIQLRTQQLARDEAALVSPRTTLREKRMLKDSLAKRRVPAGAKKAI